MCAKTFQSEITATAGDFILVVLWESCVCDVKTGVTHICGQLRARGVEEGAKRMCK